MQPQGPSVRQRLQHLGTVVIEQLPQYGGEAVGRPIRGSPMRWARAVMGRVPPASSSAVTAFSTRARSGLRASNCTCAAKTSDFRSASTMTAFGDTGTAESRAPSPAFAGTNAMSNNASWLRATSASFLVFLDDCFCTGAGSAPT